MATSRINLRTGLIAAALATGAAVGGFAIAGAATTPSTPSAATANSPTAKFHSNENATHEKGESAQREADENSGKISFGRHGNETVVTGTTADKIKTAALAAVPGTLDKAEQRADGSYEAEITKADGSEVHVSLDKNFVVTDTNSGGWHGPHDGGADGSYGAHDGGTQGTPGA